MPEALFPALSIELGGGATLLGFLYAAPAAGAMLATATSGWVARVHRHGAAVCVAGIPFDLQSWVNLHDRGGFNFLHVHEGCLLSGSFYLKVPPGSGRFVFRDPRPGVVHGYVKGAVPNGYSDIRLAPEPGLLVLFPGWMEHFVEPHENDEPRIAIAFNAVTADP